MTERLAVCGGTFDPIHRGHIEPVRQVRDAFGWDRVLYMPAFVQPFKAGRETASPFHRFAMAVLATAEHDWMAVSPWELEKGSVSYTVETLRWVRRTHPEARVEWIIGDDNVAELHRWRAVEEILGMANFVVLRRGEGGALAPELRARVSPPERRGGAGAIVFADNERVAVSATEIRERIRNDQGIEELVPAAVAGYIRRHGLYRHGARDLREV